MPTFGFSAFLKLLSLADRPQRTAIRTRLRPSESGYDFHRSLKLRAKRFLVDDLPFNEVLQSCSEIRQASEQASARQGLTNLAFWREEQSGRISAFEPVSFESPGGLFKVHFTPDFGVDIRGSRLAVHLYNTRVPLLPRMVYAALSLFPALYEDHDMPPDDLAVLSLREPRLFRAREMRDAAEFGERVIEALEDRFRDVLDDLGLPSPPPSPQPTGP